VNQPVYFILKKDESGKKVLGTIEFQSKTYREFFIPEFDQEKTSYIILGINDINKQWQEVIAIETSEDEQSETLEQKLVYCKIRIGCKLFHF